jgi:hypothetical protein
MVKSALNLPHQGRTKSAIIYNQKQQERGANERGANEK